MERIVETVDVNVPVRTCYNQWTQFESFPRFMQGIKEVRQLDDSHLHWVADVAGKHKEWDAEIVRQEPDSEIEWRSTSGAPNSGRITFQALDANRCRISCTMQYSPEGFLESLGKPALELRVKADLKRFKEYIENRQVETGAWRGEIKHGEKTSSPAGQSGTAGTTTGLGTQMPESYRR